MLKNKKILIGITGSIAAYKITFLVRLLIKKGAEVKIIMTQSATDFVSPLTLSTLCKNEVLTQLSENNSWANHVMLGRWADVMLIAPLSCNTLSKMCIGACDNLLLAVYLSATCPVVVAPAMDEDMWHHPATENNINTFRKQLDNIGFCFDWSREIRTSDPKYYKWTQWIFLQFFNSYINRERVYLD